MIERLTEKLQIFTDRLDQGMKCTSSILEAVQSRDFSKVESSTENRERLLDIIAKEQESIEGFINNLISEDLTPNNINIIKSWAFDTQTWINKVAELDDAIVNELNSSKDDVTKEIATIFKSKAAFRGYNLNDVRK